LETYGKWGAEALNVVGSERAGAGDDRTETPRPLSILELAADKQRAAELRSNGGTDQDTCSRF
jgi:hypothetical protein